MQSNTSEQSSSDDQQQKKIIDPSLYKYYGVTANVTIIPLLRKSGGAELSSDEEGKKADTQKEELVKLYGNGTKRKVDKSQTSEVKRQVSSLDSQRAKAKFEICVIYSKPSGGHGFRKLFCGAKDQLDRLNASVDTFEHERAKHSKLLIDHKDFDKDLFKECGSFLNPKFWNINLSWGGVYDMTLADILADIDLGLKNSLNSE